LLSLDALVDESKIEDSSQNPVAVVSQEKNTMRVLCCNDSATQSGVEPLLSLSTALALCPNLLTLQQQPEREKTILQQLALIAYSFSPSVIIAEQGLWLELSGCEKLFHSYRRLLQQLQKSLSYSCTHIDMGIAGSADAARLLCQPGFRCELPESTELEQQLRLTPLSLLKVQRRQQQSFEHLGLSCLEDLLALPRAELASRFGAGIVEQLQFLLGEKPCQLARFKPPVTFHDLLQSTQGIFSKQGLLFPMKTLLQRLSIYLQARQCYCRKIEWRFEPLIGEPSSMCITLSGSQNSWTTLLDLSRLQLERIDLPASIETIILSSDDFVDGLPEGLDLFGTAPSSDKTLAGDVSLEAGRLIDSLRARLGPEALQQPVLGNNYLPEEAGKVVAQGKHQQLAIDHNGLQPLWLLPKPIAIQLRNQQLFWRQPLYILSGPRRLSDNWWQTDQQRDYYLACDNEGSRYWLFKQAGTDRWFVQGLFS
jgi:protein ImuB